GDAVPRQRDERAGEEETGEAEEADEDPGDRRAVVADGVRDDGVRRREEGGGVVGMIGKEGGRKADTDRPDDDPDQFPPSAALCELQKLRHTPSPSSKRA